MRGQIQHFCFCESGIAVGGLHTLIECGSNSFGDLNYNGYYVSLTAGAGSSKSGYMSSMLCELVIELDRLSSIYIYLCLHFGCCFCDLFF